MIREPSYIKTVLFLCLASRLIFVPPVKWINYMNHFPDEVFYHDSVSFKFLSMRGAVIPYQRMYWQRLEK